MFPKLHQLGKKHASGAWRWYAMDCEILLTSNNKMFTFSILMIILVFLHVCQHAS